MGDKSEQVSIVADGVARSRLTKRQFSHDAPQRHCCHQLLVTCVISGVIRGEGGASDQN